MPLHPDTVQTRISSPLGDIRLAASPQGLVGLWFHDQRHLPAPLDGPQAWPMDEGHAVLREAAAQVLQYLDGTRTQFSLPLDLSRGTPFQQSVWRALLDIERGQTLHYGALSAHLGRASAVRAVAAAVGRNPLSVLVPCHRVLGKDGRLTGYAGGLERKAALLRLEGALAAAPAVPG